MSDAPSSLTFRILTDESGTRLDAYLARNIHGWSRGRIVRLIEDGDVLVNERPAKASYRIRENDEIEVELTEVPSAKFEPEDIPLDIVFEDESLAVINKPAGMVVHPGAGVQSGTLANAIAFHFLSEPEQMRKPAREQGRDIQLEGHALPNGRASATPNRVGIVHRLDKDTSGLIVVAKTDEVHEALSEQFRERRVHKSYVALVHGSPDENTGTIDAPIGRNKHNRLRMKVAAYGRSALSLWKVRKRYEKFTLLDVEIKTGRTHQIRVHMAYINHPLVGDQVYNEGRDKTVADSDVRKAIQKLGRFFLHAESLSFVHPGTMQKLKFVSTMPKELSEFLKIIG